MFWTYNMSFDILATVLATFPNVGQLLVQFSGCTGSEPALAGARGERTENQRLEL